METNFRKKPTFFFAPSKPQRILEEQKGTGTPDKSDFGQIADLIKQTIEETSQYYTEQLVPVLYSPQKKSVESKKFIISRQNSNIIDSSKSPDLIKKRRDSKSSVSRKNTPIPEETIEKNLTQHEENKQIQGKGIQTKTEVEENEIPKTHQKTQHKIQIYINDQNIPQNTTTNDNNNNNVEIWEKPEPTLKSSTKKSMQKLSNSEDENNNSNSKTKKSGNIGKRKLNQKTPEKNKNLKGSTGKSENQTSDKEQISPPQTGSGSEKPYVLDISKGKTFVVNIFQDEEEEVKEKEKQIEEETEQQATQKESTEKTKKAKGQRKTKDKKGDSSKNKEEEYQPSADETKEIEGEQQTPKKGQKDKQKQKNDSKGKNSQKKESQKKDSQKKDSVKKDSQKKDSQKKKKDSEKKDSEKKGSKQKVSKEKGTPKKNEESEANKEQKSTKEEGGSNKKSNDKNSVRKRTGQTNKKKNEAILKNFKNKEEIFKIKKRIKKDKKNQKKKTPQKQEEL